MITKWFGVAYATIVNLDENENEKYINIIHF
jgi:hypothetical protein